jgi:predicted amidohydrolase
MWEIELRAHAYQNGVYIAAPNRVGLDEGRYPGTEFRGESLLIDPSGEVVARGSTDREEILIGEVDPA